MPSVLPEVQAASTFPKLMRGSPGSRAPGTVFPQTGSLPIYSTLKLNITPISSVLQAASGILGDVEKSISYYPTAAGNTRQIRCDRHVPNRLKKLEIEDGGTRTRTWTRIVCEASKGDKQKEREPRSAL